MNTERFRIFVEALEALPEEIKNNEVDMRSNFEPVCGTAGCFAGLISIIFVYFKIKFFHFIFSPFLLNYQAPSLSEG
jgi:hypothetical protein